jgi:hypothetical protein
MGQDNGGRGNASEDATEAREHMRNVQENTEALADQARRVEATAPDTTDRPVEGLRVDGMGGEDNRMAAENQRNVQENTEALADQARRVEATAPDTTDREQARRVDATAPDDVNRTGSPDR